MYKDWAEGQVNKIKGILNAAREDHTSAVKQRIENVKELGGVIDVTKSLFEVSKVCDTDADIGGYEIRLIFIGNRQPRSQSLRA